MYSMLLRRSGLYDMLAETEAKPIGWHLLRPKPTGFAVLRPMGLNESREPVREPVREILRPCASCRPSILGLLRASQGIE
jgi:hypothetical protein